MDKAGMVITGASGELGEAICEKFYEDYFLILLDKKKTPLIEKLEKNKMAIFFEADLTEYKRIKGLKEKVGKYNIQAIILAAGILESKPFSQSSLDDWERALSTNLTANYVLCKELYEFLIANGGGHIVFIGSVMSKVAGYDLLSYSVSKAGMAHFSTNLALELMNYNIFVNCICPGFINTSMYKKVKECTNYNPNWIYTLGGLNKFVRIEDITSLIQYLLHQQSMNGETIVLDNGYSIR